MKHSSLVRLFQSLLVLSTLVLLAICPAHLSAQYALLAPPGSYIQSCQGIGMHGTSLYAQCKNASGTLVTARLDDAANCITDVANSNGVLQCKGAYTQTCQGLGWHGTNMFGLCTDFFGNLQPAGLDDAKSCQTDNHVIANINGALRCLLWWAPNQGFVSTPTHQRDDRTETTVWRIDQPIVNDPNPFGYSMVKFKPGDMININAGGCVQIGGHGKTWKSYVNPSGSDADHLYSGTISIPGVLEGGIQRIGGELGEHWVPRDLPPTVTPNLYLTVGYQDDGYSDNGYYAHDNGDNDQCLNAGPAWIELLVESDLTASSAPQYSPHSKPFDLVWDMNGGVDANGLPLNAMWDYQLENHNKLPNFQTTCGSAFSTGSWPSDSSSINDGILASTCTSQSPTDDLSTNHFDMFFGICRSDLLPGHLNWSLATYKGAISFADFSGGWPQDYDFNFNLLPGDNAGLTSNEKALGLEFNSQETFDHFGNPWWGVLMPGLNSGFSAAHAAMDGHFAVAIGLVGQDAVHGGYTEIHPVLGLAIRLSQTKQNDTTDEQWVYFLRNSGNEGECSHMTHSWSGLAGSSYYLPFPWPSSHVTGVRFENSQFWKDDGQAVNASHGTYSGWSYLKFQFPDASTLVDGVVTIHYEEAAGSGAEHKDVASSHSSTPAHDEDEPRWEDVEARITDPAIRQQFHADLLKADPTVKATPQRRVLVAVDNAVKDHRPPDSAARKGELTRDKTDDNSEKKIEADATKPLVDKYGKYFPKPEVK